jgi:membrane protein
MGRKLRVEADYLAGLLGKLKAMHLVGKLQQDRGQAHWALLCDPSQVTLRMLHDRLVLNLARLPRTALAQQMQGVEVLRGILDNPQLAQTLEAVFRQQTAGPAANEEGDERAVIEAMPAGRHGQA